MGPSDRGRRRAALELEAYHLLWNLWRMSRRAALDTSNWDSACELLQTYYTVNQARQNSEVCAMRIRYLEVAEPAPRLADFVGAPPYTGVPDAPRLLAQARYEYQLARVRHPQREQQRLRELETTKALYAAVRATEARARAAELARHREWQQSRWPAGVVLDTDIYSLDTLSDQVDAQNIRIESRVRTLSGLLRDGLGNLPQATPAEGDATSLAAQVDSLLTSLPLPGWIDVEATATFAAGSRELIVECRLPTVDVVPKAQSYRYVKGQDGVLETVRPPEEVNTLYANIIEQLTLLSLAAILTTGIAPHIDAVVFNGVVAAKDPRSGKPIRPCLVSVRVSPDAFAELDLANADPRTCLERLSATVSQNPAELLPVRPLPT
ncbi:hypothetical protein BN1232_02782 [Mycobacterium rhizamassiliense]|uniref:Restriction endonuclease n=1 Tax=Mycobacterium rhizamassiliense TaxID=1841860 RepID=A0A2U3NZJ8_9MYCO|nr:hypothetical protein [Mycobacterium rhizamassiliense]SPM36875.1 hypothetical protein BN1232_02782 [Mycobacterium rhizamassiliense]